MLIVTDNIDVACASIEKAAMDRAVAEVDDAFSIAYADRRIHRDVCIIHSRQSITIADQFNTAT